VDTFEHVLDAKGRAVLPTSLRPPFAEGAVVTLWDGPCLAVFTPAGFEDWRTFLAGQLPSSGFDNLGAHVRYVNARSAAFRPDGQGRFVLPDRLRHAAGIERTITITGAGNRVELWNPASYPGGIDTEEMEQNITFLQATYDLPRT